MEFKYVVFYDEDNDREIPIIFPKCLNHDSICRAVRGIPENVKGNVFWIPVSAGFVNLMTCVCHGNSVSMERHYPYACVSRPEHDQLIIMLYNWQHGKLEPRTAKILMEKLERVMYAC